MEWQPKLSKMQASTSAAFRYEFLQHNRLHLECVSLLYPRLCLLVTEASLRVDEFQNLNDEVADLTKAAVRLNLRFYLRIELGPASQVSDETMAKLNELLEEVSDKLRLQRR